VWKRPLCTAHPFLVAPQAVEAGFTCVSCSGPETAARSFGGGGAGGRVARLVRTKLGSIWPLERLTLLADHRQLTLWSDSALKKFDSCDEGDFPELSFLQMPVVLARGIFGISIYNVSNYTPMIMHGSTSHISISLAE